MSISIHVGEHSEPLGSGSYLHSFLSTISHHLEPQGWGTRYPELMVDLSQGSLRHSKSRKALQDLVDIQKTLKKYSPRDVVWDINDLGTRPPWGDDIDSDITDLSNYFITSSGKDMFQVIADFLKISADSGLDVLIE